MKTWQEHGPRSMKIIFWTDEVMDTWVKIRFGNTRLYEGWKLISNVQDAHIKRADVFRVLLVWYYSGIYTDLDIEVKDSMLPLLNDGMTTLVFEPEESMLQWTREFRKGSPRKTLVLSGILLSGARFSEFLGFYINWVMENHLTGRSKAEDHVIDATGPRIEAEAYYHYIDRLAEHDHRLRTLSYPEFQHYGEHYSETTWVAKEVEKDPTCIEVATVYSARLLLFGKAL